MKIFIPKDTSAVAVGADDVALALSHARETLKAEICRNGSRGAFWLEPLVEVEIANGRHAFGPVEVEDVPELLACLAGRLEDHPKYLGLTADIPWLANQERVTFARAGLGDPACVHTYRKLSGFSGLEKSATLAPQEIVTQILDSGLRGRGGAAFPTGIKWQTVLDTPSDQKYIVCNADEGDSGTFADRLLMEADPFQLIEGMVIAGAAVGATLGYIYLRSEYPLAHQQLLLALDVARREGYLGKNILNSGRDFEIELRLGAGAYICGEETSLLSSLEGRRGLVRAKPPLPAKEGLFGKPTVVNNVLTLAAVTTIMSKGSEYYASLGTGRSLGTLTVQLAGNVAKGGLVEIPFGLKLSDVLKDYAGGTFSGRSMYAIQVGGPLGAYLDSTRWDTPMEYEEFAKVGGMLGHGGVVIFDDSADMLAQASFAMEFCAHESCGKCTPCRIGAVRGAEVIEKIRKGHRVNENLILLEDLCETMESGSLCAMGGLTPGPVRSALKYFDFSVKGPDKSLSIEGIS